MDAPGREDGLGGVFTLDGVNANWRHPDGPGLGAEGSSSMLAWFPVRGFFSGHFLLHHLL